MTKAYIRFQMKDAVLMTVTEGSSKAPIVELYHTDNGQSLLLWLTPNGKGWQRKVYKHSVNAENALVERAKEYLEYFCGENYQLIYNVFEGDERVI